MNLNNNKEEENEDDQENTENQTNYDINSFVDSIKRNEIVTILKNNGFLFPVTRVRVS